MFWCNSPNGVARIEVDNDDFLVCPPTRKDTDRLTEPFKNWDIKKQKITADFPMKTKISGVNEEKKAFQHCGLQLTLLPKRG